MELSNLWMSPSNVGCLSPHTQTARMHSVKQLSIMLRLCALQSAALAHLTGVIGGWSPRSWQQSYSLDCKLKDHFSKPLVKTMDTLVCTIHTTIGYALCTMT
eukprot:5076222-Amphidinium_carterae.1